MAKILVQPTATRLPQNLLTYSNSFENTVGGWATVATRTADYTTGPFGDTDAVLLDDVSASVFQGAIKSGLTGFKMNSEYIFSIYIKKTTGATYFPGLSFIFSGGTSVRQDTTIDTNDGSLHQRTGGSFSDGTTTIEDKGDYWRVALQLNSSDNNTARIDVYPSVGSDVDGLSTWTGTVPGSNVFFGAQIENYDTVGTYTKTTTTAINGGNRVLTRLPQNLLLQSENFSLNKTYLRATYNAANATDPEGNPTAYEVTEDATASNSHYVSHSFSADADTTYVESVYAKANTRSRIAFRRQTATALPAPSDHYIDLTDGSVVNDSWSGITVTDVGNGWYRCSVVVTTDGTGGTAAPSILVLDNSGTFDNYNGDGSSGVYLWGWQVEKYADLGEYVKTTTAAVPGVTRTRASTATYYDHNGILQTAAVGQERTDYDPSDNSLRGLLIEEARTNICEYSEEFASWPLLNTPTFNSNSEIAPDGTQTADRVGDNNATAYEACQGTFTIVDSTVYTYSMYMKKETSVTNYPGIEIYMSTGSVFHLINFDPVNGTAIEKTDAGFTATSGGITIEDHGDYWRIIGTFTGSGTSCRYSLYPAINTTHSTGISTASQQEVVVWGAQLEAGASASSYIPNLSTGSTTRVADQISITDLTQIGHNASAGSVFVRATAGSVTGSDRVFSIDNGSANRLFDVYLASGEARAYGSTTLAMTGVNLGVTADTEFLYAGAFAENDAASVVDGGTVVTDSSYSPLPTPILMRIGNLNNGSFLDGHISALTYYPKRLTNTALVTLSSGGSFITAPPPNQHIKIAIGVY